MRRESFETEFGKQVWDDHLWFLGTRTIPLSGEDLRPNGKQGTIDTVVQPEKISHAVNVPPREPKVKAEEIEAVFCEPRKTPTLYDIVQYYVMEDVIDEESLSAAITLAAVGGISFGVEGFSGSGKTHIVDRLMRLIPREWVYKIELSSKTAVFYEADAINRCRIVYIPELQKAMQDKKSPIIEVIKNLTEGKDASRIVTRSDKTGSIEYSIKKGKSVIYTLALENYFKKDEESSRRLMRLQTDSSQEHLALIHEQKARQRFTLGVDTKKAERLKKRLTEHLQEVAGRGNLRVIDPCSEYFRDLIPKTQKSVGYVDHYYHLVDACARWHYRDRESFSVNGTTYIIANVEDHFNVFEMYFREFTKTLRDFAERMADGEEKARALEELVEVRNPNWNECLDRAYEVLQSEPSLALLRESSPALADRWKQLQLTHGDLATLDYKTGQILPMVRE